jgi:hypothetical protein
MIQIRLFILHLSELNADSEGGTIQDCITV